MDEQPNTIFFLLQPLIHFFHANKELFLGSLITIVVSWFFFYRAGLQLRDEARDLRRLNLIQMRSLKDLGLIDYVEDESGYPVGNKYIIKANLKTFKFTPHAATIHFDPQPQSAESDVHAKPSSNE